MRDQVNNRQTDQKTDRQLGSYFPIFRGARFAEALDLDLDAIQSLEQLGWQFISYKNIHIFDFQSAPEENNFREEASKDEIKETQIGEVVETSAKEGHTSTTEEAPEEEKVENHSKPKEVQETLNAIPKAANQVEKAEEVKPLNKEPTKEKLKPAVKEEAKKDAEINQELQNTEVKSANLISIFFKTCPHHCHDILI